MKLDFKSKKADSRNWINSQAQGFTSQKYDGIKVKMDNLTEDRSLEKENEFPN